MCLEGGGRGEKDEWLDRAWDLINYLASRLNTVQDPVWLKDGDCDGESKISDGKGNRGIDEWCGGGKSLVVGGVVEERKSVS